MYFPDDETLFSIGAVAIAPESDELDTSSDVSDWVLQYTDWEDDTPAGKVPLAS
jgi:hypothetical protein